MPGCLSLRRKVLSLAQECRQYPLLRNGKREAFGTAGLCPVLAKKVGIVCVAASLLCAGVRQAPVTTRSHDYFHMNISNRPKEASILLNSASDAPLEVGAGRGVEPKDRSPADFECDTSFSQSQQHRIFYDVHLRSSQVRLHCVP